MPVSFLDKLEISWIIFAKTVMFDLITAFNIVHACYKKRLFN